MVYATCLREFVAILRGVDLSLANGCSIGESEVGAVFCRVQQDRALGLGRLSNAFDHVNARAVHDDGIARLQSRSETAST
jgi:hypothetical protein